MDDYFINKSFYSTLGGNGEFLKLLQKMVKFKNYWEKPSFSQINYTDYDLYVLIMNVSIKVQIISMVLLYIKSYLRTTLCFIKFGLEKNKILLILIEFWKKK